jgi:hypothetical protein
MAENLLERKALSLQWLVQSKSSLRSARTAFPSTQSASRTRLAPEVDFQPNTCQGMASRAISVDKVYPSLFIHYLDEHLTNFAGNFDHDMVVTLWI